MICSHGIDGDFPQKINMQLSNIIQEFETEMWWENVRTVGIVDHKKQGEQEYQEKTYFAPTERMTDK